MTISAGQAQKASEILAAAGVGNWGSPPSDDEVQGVLKRFGQYVAGVGPLLKTVSLTGLATALRMSGYCTADMAGKLARAAVAEAETAGSPDDETAWLTYGRAPGGEVLVDVVQRGGDLEWVVARPPGSAHLHEPRFEIVPEVPGRHPWPRAALPWAIPAAEDVEAAWTDDDPRALSFDLINVFRHTPEDDRHIVLPDPRGPLAVFLAMWVMGTYLLDQFRYYPIILMEAPRERGKSRLGKLAAHLGFRGIETATPTPATIFRNRSRHRVTLFLDVKDLPGRMARSDDIADLVLSSFERDKKVSRVLRPDAPTPPGEMKHFTVYGATVLATNERVKDDDPLVSRCLPIVMPEAGQQKVRPAVRPDDPLILGLRARLVAWAARVIGDGTRLLEGREQRLSGRVRDIGLPLLQVTGLVRPEAYDAVLKVLVGEQAAQRAEASDSWEARVVAALIELRAEGQWPGTVGVGTVTDRVNKDRPEREQLTPQRVGRVAKSLGLRKDNRKDHRYLVYPGDEIMDGLATRYGAENKLSNSANSGPE